MSSKAIPLAMLAATLAITACSVEKKGTTGNEDVKIETPFGGMKVKTNDAVAAAEIGLPVYPGSTLLKKDRNNGAADIDIGFAGFHLSVRAVSYHTPDSSDKVRAFYRKELARFGDVIECAGNHPLGTPAKTSEGLTCDDGKHLTIHDVDRQADAEVELKTGSKMHQHIVAIEPSPDGAKFGLVSFDLPKDDKESN
jgi:hypothetical protein